MQRSRFRRTVIPFFHWLPPLALAFALTLAGCGSGGGTGGAPATAIPLPGGGDGPDTTEARVSDVTPRVLDRDRGGTLTLAGTGLRSPVVIRLVDRDGAALRAPLSASATDGGARVVVDVPAVDALGAEVSCELRVRNGDGRDVATAPTIALRREYRTLDGTSNHATDPERGAAGIPFRRAVPPAYADGLSTLAGPERPNARAISNAVCAQEDEEEAAFDASGFLWQWGQFLDHDIVLTAEADPAEEAPIAVPLGDPSFDPFATGTAEIPFHRSAWMPGIEPRQQINGITAWIDGSCVYGSDAARASALRTLDGTGRLRTSEGDLLPFNTDGLPNAGGTDASLFLAGDVRANEQVGLTAMHTLFVREHNRLVDRLRAEAPELTGDELYEEARRIVAAQIQVITYEEFLPLLLGPGALPPYAGYDPNADADISNVFATAAYRFGHSLLPTTVLRLDAQGGQIAAGHLSLRDAFFHPELLAEAGGIEPILRGLAFAPSQALDAQVVEDVRSFLFGPPGAGGLDLAALNLQRGRDHGLASYAEVRAGFGLSRPLDFADVTRDLDTELRLLAAYGDVARLDPWIGALAEDAEPDALVGPLLRRVLADEFRRLRDGDRFYYERTFHGEALAQLRSTRLADLIRCNTTIGDEIDLDVFRVGGVRPPAPGLEAQPLSADRERRLRAWRGMPPRPR